jgi:hypothetical protein
MGLRDYYHEKWSSEVQGAKGGSELQGAEGDSEVQGAKRGSEVQVAKGGDAPSSAAKLNSDGWALAYLNIHWLQPISESFDDDASGFLTVTEVNTFTQARPLSWR